MKKIGFFIGSLRTGGAEKHVLDIITNLDKSKYVPYLLLFKYDGQYKKSFEKLGIDFREFPLSKFNLFQYLYRLYDYTKYLKKNKIDVLHIHLIGTYTFACLGAYFAGVKDVIITWHNVYDEDKIKSSTKNWFKRIRIKFVIKFASLFANKIVAVSNEVKIVNTRIYKCNPDKVYVVHNGIKKIEKVRVDKKSDDCFTIGIIGSLTYQKGHEYLLISMVSLLDKYPQIKLKIAGGGPLEEPLKKFVIKNELQNSILFLGDHKNIPMLLSELDLWVMSSLYEGFSIALLEAMSAEVPIIATDVGGNSEAIISDKFGLIIPPKSPESITKSIEFMINNPDYRRKVAINSKKMFENNFTLGTMIDKLDSLYKSNKI